MSDITIPPEALEKGARAAYDTWRDKIRENERDVVDADMLDEIAPKWDDLGESRNDWINQTRAACLAMLEAWPGSEYVYRQPHRRAVSYSKPAIILPLTENSNDKG